jgi:putative DNA primase/helicase
VAVAFDAGNLAAVAKVLRQRYPAALLVLCGDDDRATEARTGTNTGRVKAEAAARAVSGFTAFPEGLPEGASDFNDMHRAHGLEAVRGTVEGAIAAALQAPQAPAPAPASTRPASGPIRGRAMGWAMGWVGAMAGAQAMRRPPPLTMQAIMTPSPCGPMACTTASATATAHP